MKTHMQIQKKASPGTAEKRRLMSASLAAILGNVLWGISFLFTRIALRTSDPYTMLSVRFSIAFLLLNIPVLLGRKHISLRRKNLIPLLMLAGSETLGFFFETYGVKYTNSSYSGLIQALVPIVAMLIAIPCLHEYPSRRQLVFSLFPVAGVVMMTFAGERMGIIRPIGVVFLVFTCITSALSKLTRRKSAQIFSPFEQTYLIVFITAVVFTLGTLIRSRGSFSIYGQAFSSREFFFSVSALSFLCSIAANLFINYAAQHLTVGKLAIYGTLNAPCSMIAGMLILNEPMNLLSTTGAALILFGIWMFVQPEKN